MNVTNMDRVIYTNVLENNKDARQEILKAVEV